MTAALNAFPSIPPLCSSPPRWVPLHLWLDKSAPIRARENDTTNNNWHTRLNHYWIKWSGVEKRRLEIVVIIIMTIVVGSDDLKVWGSDLFLWVSGAKVRRSDPLDDCVWVCGPRRHLARHSLMLCLCHASHLYVKVDVSRSARHEFDMCVGVCEEENLLRLEIESEPQNGVIIKHTLVTVRG